MTRQSFDAARLAPLFAPFTLKGLALPNRIVMAPMTRSFSPDQVPGADVAAYYRRRAEGGVGLILTEGTTLSDQTSTGDHRVPKLAGERSLAGWRAVVEAVHAAGGKIFPQIWHVGALRRADRTPLPDLPSRSPSGMASPGKLFGAPATDAELAETIAAFGEAARNAMSLGFDGVEIHGAHGYLIDQFFWAGTNQRTDRFGGDLVARTRFAVEVIRAIRTAMGPEKPLILRFSQWKQQDFSARLATTPAELEAFLTPMAAAGVDCFHCSTRRFWEPEFDGSPLNLAGWAKKLTGLPTITVGSIGLEKDFITTYGADSHAGTSLARLEELARRLEAGEFDLAAVGRALLMNPDWPKLIRAGRFDDVVPFDREKLAALV
ncbi:MAG: NADH:flavin oxidoreductase [Alphaproteobacteria bacterium]|nr:NADH:flavin oxidoreductase [Alphaproteobacteria bacterium]